MKQYTEEMKLWLFDLAHGNLKDSDIIIGFTKHYVLFDQTIQDVKRDILFHTSYGSNGAITALDSISNTLEKITANELKFSND